LRKAAAWALIWRGDARARSFSCLVVPVLKGGREKQITPFTVDSTDRFQYRAYNKWIVMSRGWYKADAVLFREGK